jgi:transcriptional regulator with XRE-family HTH domain
MPPPEDCTCLHHTILPPLYGGRALRKLGADIHDARRRRRLPMAVVAKRALTSRSTLQRVEAGDANVSIGIYAAVPQALGLLDGLGEIADIARDSVGQTLASAELPKRVRLKRTAAPTTPPAIASMSGGPTMRSEAFCGAAGREPSVSAGFGAFALRIIPNDGRRRRAYPS